MSTRALSKFHFAVLALVLAGSVATAQRVRAQDTFEPGEAFVTRFSGTTTNDGRAVIDMEGAVGGIVDLRNPDAEPRGAQIPDKALRAIVTAGDVGQVFGVALDEASPPNVYLTATSAFGLHRNSDNTDWMDGMWGRGGGPGTVWKLDAQNDYKPAIFARIQLNGRKNTGAALGNIAYDRWNQQLYVTDLETGMIHRLSVKDGADLGHYDHGTVGRGSFLDAQADEERSLSPVPFDTDQRARLHDCPSGDFARTPSCWGFADFRRRVWGVGVRRDADGAVRVYYSVWSSQGFGNPAYAAASEDQPNSVWSVGIGPDGEFDSESVRREFFLPDFFRTPDAIARAGRSHPVTDIAFPAMSAAPVMVLAERGGVRNLGLTAENAFATPNEARVLRYRQNEEGVWEAVGRYDVGFYDRKNEGPPYVRAGASGGAAFGLGYTADWKTDPKKPDAFVWMTGDGLCTRRGPCLDPAKDTKSDAGVVDGLTGREEGAYEEIVPAAAFQPYPAPGPATAPDGPDRSFVIDLDGDMAQADATRMGDIAIYTPGEQKPDLKISKIAQAERCDPGSDCTFNVEIENVSDVFYEGPLTIKETPDGGAELVSHSPDDWTCEAFVSEATGTYECRHEAVTLEPGDKIALELTFTVPDTWDRNVFRNCAEITTPGFGEDAHDYNNTSCDYVPAVAPDVPNYGPDLMVEKFPLDWSCDWAGVCRFVVRVTNVGSDDYTGPLRIHETPTTPGTTLAHWEIGPWNCGPLGASTFDCAHPAVTLTPGEFREVIVWLQAPPIGAGFTHVHNCARFDWDGADADYNPGNEYDCADVYRYPPGHPDARAQLTVRKMSSSTCAHPGDWSCWNVITITNSGGAPYLDQLVVTDTNAILAGPADATLIAVGGVPWACAPGIGATGVQTCTHPAIAGGLQPGESLSLTLVTQWPNAVAEPNIVRNCASVNHDNDGDGVDETIEACAYSQLCTIGAGGNCANDLAVFKQTDPNPCWPGFPCSFIVSVTNDGPNPHPAGLVITDVPNPDAGVFTKVWESTPITCVPAGTNQTCTVTNAIPAGVTVNLAFTLDVPVDYPWTSLKNCANVALSANNIFPINDESCVEAYIPGPDLEPWSGTECRRGESCELEGRIDNSGKRPFKGATGVQGRLSPELKIASITSETSGLNCSVTGEASYECKAADLSLKPGTSATYKLIVDVPAEFPHDAVSHIKSMEWPDSKVKDRNPRNDQHTSTITIVGPQEPEEPEELLPPPPPSGPECRPGWRQVSPARARRLQERGWLFDEASKGGETILCGKPPPSCSGGQVWNVDRRRCECPRDLEWDPRRHACVKPLPPPQCKPGWSNVDRQKATALRAMGWQIERIGRGDRSILCGRPPQCGGGQRWDQRQKRCVCPGKQEWDPKRKACTQPEPPACPAGWSEVGKRSVQSLRSQGWQFRKEQRGGRTILCCRPPQCGGGQRWDPKRNSCVCPPGQEWDARRKSCSKPPPEPPLACKPGWSPVDRNKAKALRVLGWQIEQIGQGHRSILCGKAPTLACLGGKVEKGQCICPRGMERKQVGKVAFRCVKSAPTPPPPSCDKGWTQVDRSKAKALAKQGWQIQFKGNIACAKPPSGGHQPSPQPPPTRTPPPNKGPTLQINPQLLKKIPGFQ